MTSQSATTVEHVDASALFAQLALTQLDELPESAIQMARLDVLDTLGCALGGASQPGVPEARDLLLGSGGRAEATVWGSGSRLPAAQAAFINAMSSHALDYDDIHPGVTHTGASVIPAAFAAAEASGSEDFGDVLGAIVVGTEVADRIAVSITDGPGVTGWLLTPLVGFFGAAAASARLYGLPSERVRDALGFAYVQASGNGQSTLDGALAKRMQPGFASRGGVFAAELARTGLTGPTDGLEGTRGFFHVYHRGRYDKSVLRSGRMPTWMIEETTFKPYPCCGWTHSALECGLNLRSRGIPTEDVLSVDILVNAQAYNSTGTPLPRRYRPATVVDGQFSIPYVFAVAMCTGGLRLGDFDTDALRRPEVLNLASKVRVAIDESLTGDAARALSPASVSMQLADGATETTSVDLPRGINPPLGLAEVEQKFAECCAYAGRPKSFAAAVAQIVIGDRSDFGELLHRLESQTSAGMPGGGR